MTGFDEKYLSKEGTEENETNEIVRDTNLELGILKESIINKSLMRGEIHIIDLSDTRIKERVDKVYASHESLTNMYKKLGGRGNHEHANLRLIDPKEKAIVVDPKTQTLYYIEKGVAINIIQVALGRGNDGDVSTIKDSFSTPPGTLTVYSNTINIMSDGRPSLLVDGLEESNKNTDTREILIHPTGVPGGKTTGKPTSFGCITMDTDLWTFCKKNFSKGIMINVINDAYDYDETVYFKNNVIGKTLTIDAPNALSTSIAAVEKAANASSTIITSTIKKAIK